MKVATTTTRKSGMIDASNSFFIACAKFSRSSDNKHSNIPGSFAYIVF